MKKYLRIALFMVLLVAMPFIPFQDLPGSFFPLLPQTDRAQATTTNATILEDAYLLNYAEGYGDLIFGSWLKFNIVPYSGQTITQALLKLYVYSGDYGYDEDMRVGRIVNQTWVEETTDQDWFNATYMPQDMNSSHSGLAAPYWSNIDVTDIVQAEITAAHSNCSFHIDDPDYPHEVKTGYPYSDPEVNGTDIKVATGKCESGYQTTSYLYSKEYNGGSHAPYLEVSYYVPHTGDSYTILTPSEDVSFRYWPQPGYIYVYAVALKFNISAIPTDIAIDAAILRLNVTSVLGTGNLQIVPLKNQTWTEDSAFLSTLVIGSGKDTYSGLETGIQTITVTESFNYAYENSYTNASFYLLDLAQYPTIGEDDQIPISEWDNDAEPLIYFGGWSEYGVGNSEHNIAESKEGSIAAQLLVTPTPTPIEEVTVTVQPTTMVPQFEFPILFGGWYSTIQLLADDNDKWGINAGTNARFGFYFETPYSQCADTFSYELYYQSGDDDEQIFLYAWLDGELYTADYTHGNNPTINSEIQLNTSHFHNGRADFGFWLESGAGPSSSCYMDQLSLNFTSFDQIYPLTTYLSSIDEKTELQSVEIPVLEPFTNITLSALSTGYTLEGIYPQCSYVDEISTAGNLTLYNTAKTSYKVIFSTGRTRHILHMAAHAQDGLGLKWESFKWYLNNSRVPFPQEHEIYAGTYALIVRDYYEENVATGSFTVPSTDPRHTYLEISVLHYLYTLGNWDRKEYTANVTRNARTTSYSLAGYPCSISFYLYGTVNGVNYTVQYFDKDGASVGNDTITMENDAQSGMVDYISGDELPDVKVGPGGGGTVIMGLPLDTLLFIVFPVTATFIFTGYIAWKQRGSKTPKPVEQPVTAQDKSKALREAAENRKKTVRH